jgi:chromatin remodeling complex protein RSC6
MLDRPTAAKLVWQYIKKHGLQRLGYDKQIIVDDRLLAVLQHARQTPKKPADFHKPVIEMYPLTKAIDRNLSEP